MKLSAKDGNYIETSIGKTGNFQDYKQLTPVNFTAITWLDAVLRILTVNLCIRKTSFLSKQCSSYKFTDINLVAGKQAAKSPKFASFMDPRIGCWCPLVREVSSVVLPVKLRNKMGNQRPLKSIER